MTAGKDKSDPSVLRERLRDGRIPGRKVGHGWFMTDQDILDTIDICKNDLRTTNVRTGLTPRSRQRVKTPAEVEAEIRQAQREVEAEFSA